MSPSMPRPSARCTGTSMRTSYSSHLRSRSTPWLARICGRRARQLELALLPAVSSRRAAVHCAAERLSALPVFFSSSGGGGEAWKKDDGADDSLGDLRASLYSRRCAREPTGLGAKSERRRRRPGSRHDGVAMPTAPDPRKKADQDRRARAARSATRGARLPRGWEVGDHDLAPGFAPLLGRAKRRVLGIKDAVFSYTHASRTDQYTSDEKGHMQDGHGRNTTSNL